ncbi:MAG: hypothetical protein ACFFAO_12930 [Candidatus Hermodarchaeota archaeon]
MHKKRSIFQGYFKIMLLFFISFLVLTQLISISVANGDDDVGDIAKDLGWVAVGLFSVAILYVIFYQIFINSKKILPKNEKFEKRRDNIKKIYIKVRKPLSLLHYFAASAAIIILLIHGISLIGNEAEKVIIGLVAGSFYLVYIIMGILIKVVFKKSKKALKVRKIHTNLIIFAIIGIITIVHIIIAE